MRKLLALLLSLVLLGGLVTTATTETLFTPGTYQGEGKGIHDMLKVEVTVDESKILEIKITEHTETPGISDAALEQVPQDIIKYQSLLVDTVAGATVTSVAILTAVEEALKSSGADVEKLKVEVEKEVGEGQLIEKTADVVVVGGGGAGLAAAVSVLQNGGTVLVLEKMPVLGGSTIIAGGQYNAVDDKRQGVIEMRPELIEQAMSYVTEEPKNDLHKETITILKKQIEEYQAAGSTYIFDSPELHALQAWRGGDYVADLELVLTLTRGAEESIAWLESQGVAFQDQVATVTGALWPRTHQFVKPLVTGPIDAFREQLAAAGDKAEVLMNTQAQELIMEDGRVVGVKAVQGENEVIAKAAKGVILATGGFARNAELIKRYDTHWGGLDGLNSTNSVSATGDGIIMAQAVGAALTGMEWIQLLPVGHPETGGMAGNISINAANQLFVNINGERFVAEDARRDTLTQGLLEQPEQKMFILHDAHEYYNEDVKNDFNETIGELVANGTAVKGDTLAELAQNMGVPAENLEKAVAEYNKAVAGEQKDAFGKNLLQDPFDKPPFYASLRVPTIHHTMGGLMIDTSARVLDQNGAPIPGLYAAGEVTGGIHGANRLGGNAIPDVMVFAKIAGQSAVEQK